MARPKNTEQRRSEIVSGLQTAMAELGYERASIKTIAAAAGLSPGLVHYHFHRKIDILLALIERLAAVVERRFQERLLNASTPWERVDAFLDARLALDPQADPAAVVCWVVLGAEALRQPEVRAPYAEAVMRDLAVLTGLLSEIAPDRAARGAALLMATIQGAYQLATVTDAIPTGSAAPTTKAMARSLMAPR